MQRYAVVFKTNFSCRMIAKKQSYQHCKFQNVNPAASALMIVFSNTSGHSLDCLRKYFII